MFFNDSWEFQWSRRSVYAPWDSFVNQSINWPIDSFHIVSVHAPNSLVPRYLREITLKGATLIRLPMHYTMEYEKR